MAPSLLLELLGQSPGIVAVRETAARLLQRQSERGRLPPVLIQGETGVGKGLLARVAPPRRPRASGPFVDVNCAAIPETLLEAELFGYERGAFTDARHAKAGLFQTANHGTIFLDEVGLLPEALQAKLLKALEDRAVRRLGSTRSEPVDVWIVAASNENLRRGGAGAAIPRGPLPPSRRRDADLPPLRGRGRGHAPPRRAFPRTGVRGLPASPAKPRAGRAGGAPRLPVARQRAGAGERDGARRAPVRGAGRERRAARVARRAGARPRPRRAGSGRRAGSPALAEALGSVEREHLVEALRQTAGNVTRAAARLGISRDTLRYRMVKHGLVREEPARPARARTSRPDQPAPPGEPTLARRRAAGAGTGGRSRSRPARRWRSDGRAGGSRSSEAPSSCRPTTIPGSVRAAGSKPWSRRSRRSGAASRR